MNSLFSSPTTSRRRIQMLLRLTHLAPVKSKISTSPSLSFGLSLSLPTQCQIRPSLRLTHYLSSNAATPGSTLPSINSREAPPPVET